MKSIKRVPLLGLIKNKLIIIFGLVAIAFVINMIATNPEKVENEPTKVKTMPQNDIIEEAPQTSVPTYYETTSDPSDSVYLGTFKISAYCHCSKCCGKSDGITATGTKVAANRTIAVDPNVIPLGSEVLIDGQVYVAEDTGGNIKGNRIDMYFPTHQAALNWGIKYKEVTLLN